jgi:excisionase family DNA binding protein
MADKQEQPKMEFYTTKTLGQMAGLSPDYIRQLILGGKIKAQKIGRDWAISANEVMRFLRDRRE